MLLFGAITKVLPQPDGTVHVEGIASTESVDDQGEVVTSSAMRAAIPNYMAFPALREMHQLSAAGTTLEADVGDDGITRIVARVVDPVAVTKVRAGVYRGFSIGGRVTERDAANHKIITGLMLNEISLVDRPANPDAVLNCWKASQTDIQSKGSDMEGLATIGDLAGDKLAAMMTAPVQIWACGMADHQHAAKADALKCMEKRAAAEGDPGTAEAEPPDDLAEKAEATGANRTQPDLTGDATATIKIRMNQARPKKPPRSTANPLQRRKPRRSL